MEAIFKYEFMKLALVVGVIVSIITSYFSVFIVQRNLAFLGSGLAHSSFAGIAIGLFLGFEPVVGAIVYCLFCGLSLVFLKWRSPLQSDTLVGVIFAVSMALGAILISLMPNPNQEAFRYLFGSLLGLGSWDLYTAIFVLGLSLMAVSQWKIWAFSSFDRALASAEKRKTLREDFILISFVSVAIAISVKILGMILLAAFLVMPAAAARLVSDRFSTMTVWSIIFGSTSCIVGLVASFFLDLPTGPCIIAILSIIFAVCLMIKGLLKTN